MDTTAASDRERPRIYLAGPDVFLPNARAVGAAKCSAAARYGLEGVFPLDVDLDLAGLPPDEQARRIAIANEALMRSCAGAVANLAPFRGVSMDSGTAYEVGFMRALGRPVAGYTTTAADYATRARCYGEAPSAAPDDSATPDMTIEDFGLAENLMIAVGVHDSTGTIEVGTLSGPEGIAAFDAFERCLVQIARLLVDTGFETRDV